MERELRELSFVGVRGEFDLFRFAFFGIRKLN